MMSEAGGPFINVDRLDLRKYAARTSLSRVLCDYLIYSEHNMKRALELCALATQANDFSVRASACMGVDVGANVSVGVGGGRLRLGLHIQATLAGTHHWSG